jgi:hypothetical protein
MVRPTGMHKFYSEDRRDWADTEELEVGGRLRSIDGWLTVKSLVKQPGVHRVYNMTVAGEHVYHVSSLGLLSHNVKACKNPHGQHGKPDHRNTVEQLAEKAKRKYSKGYTIHEGTSIKSKTGVNRRPDVWVEDAKGNVVKVYEAARKNKGKGGDFVSRERKKQVEYDDANIPSHFEEVK